MTKNRSKRKRTSRFSTYRFKRKKCSVYGSVSQRNLENCENSNKNTSSSENRISVSKVSLLLMYGISFFLWVPKLIYEGTLSFLQIFLQAKNVSATDLEEIKQRMKCLEDKIEGIHFQRSTSQNISSNVMVAVGHCCKCNVGPTTSGMAVIAPPPPPPLLPPLAPTSSLHIPAVISSSVGKQKLDLNNKKTIQKTPALHAITLDDLKSVKLRKTKRKMLPDSPDTKKMSFANEESWKSTLLRIRGTQCYANKENFSVNGLSVSPSAKHLDFRRVLRNTNQPKSPGGTPLQRNFHSKQTLKTPPAIQAARKLLTAEYP